MPLYIVEGWEGSRTPWPGAALPPPSLYRAPRGEALGYPIWWEGRRPGRVACPPSQGGRLLQGFPPTLGAWALGGGWCPAHLGAGSHPPTAHKALRGRWTLPVDPWNPFGGPSTILINPETFPVTETGLPTYKYLPTDHSGTPHDVRDLIRDSEQHSVTAYIYSL